MVVGVGAATAIAAIMVVLGVVWQTEQDAGGAMSAPAGSFERPMPWADAHDPAAGEIDLESAVLRVGGVEVAAPGPLGVRMSWRHETRGAREVLIGTGEVAAEPATFEWAMAQGNPHTVFSGELKARRDALTEPVTSVIALPDGELTYVDPMLARVPFAGTAVEISALTSGPIIWRNGNDALSLWQWNADRVTLAASEAGGFVVQFHWWDPQKHAVPERCSNEIGASDVTITPRLTISFGEVPRTAMGRLPDGVTSAVVPIFFDAQQIADPRFRDGASAGADDFIARARTIAFGHSSTTDARYGNGGLAGLDVGGTVVVPAVYDATTEPFEELRDAMSSATIELVEERALRPADCGELVAARGSSHRALLGEARPFDGKFPNVFAPDQRSAIPGFASGAGMWQPTALTGRRRDVVTQALSSTYLNRLADARGVAMLEIPLIATRNPLVAVAAEALLEPERGGNWTIQEDVARALAEVELLSEGERFDFIGLGRFAAHTAGLRHVVFDEVSPGGWTVFNAGDDALDGFTLIFDGEVSATVDGAAVERLTRTLGNGGQQTWVWWDLSAGARYELRLAGDPIVRRPVTWKLSAN